MVLQDRFCKLLVLVFVLAGVAAAHPAAAQWSSNGPCGGEVASLAFDPASPQTVYASTRTGGVFKSTDSAASWTAPAGLSEPGFQHGQLTITPDGDLFVIPGCCAREVYRSTDGGNSWDILTSGIEDQLPRAIAADPVASSTVFIGTSAGVYKTTDGGTSWAASNTGIEDRIVEAIAVDPVSTLTVYAGINNGGVFKSTDSGATWSASNAGIENTTVVAVVVDPATPATIYLATRSDGAFKSLDSGASWNAVGAGLPAEVTAIAVDPSSTSTVYLGALGHIFRSDDGGGTWSELDADVIGADVRSILVDPTSSDRIYAGTGLGVHKSVDGGLTWSRQNSGLQAMFVQQVLLDPTLATTAYAASADAGIFKSEDAAASWQDASTGLPTLAISGQGAGLAISLSQPQRLYVSLFEQIFKTENGGTAWSSAIDDPSNFGVIGPSVLPLAVHPSDPDVVFAGQLFPLFDEAGIYRTTDGGLLWQQVYLPDTALTTFQPVDIAIDPQDPDRIYAGILTGITPARSFLVLRSTDGGDSWDEVLAGDGFKFPKVALDPVRPLSVTVGFSTGGVTEIFSSTDGGDTWEGSTVGCASLADLTADPSVEGRLFAACINALIVSPDQGRSWAVIDDAGLPPDRARSVAIAPTSPRTLHVGNLHGVYSTTLDVDSLFIFSDGFESGDVTAWSSSTP